MRQFEEKDQLHLHSGTVSQNPLLIDSTFAPALTCPFENGKTDYILTLRTRKTTLFDMSYVISMATLKIQFFGACRFVLEARPGLMTSNLVLKSHHIIRFKGKGGKKKKSQTNHGCNRMGSSGDET